MIETIPYSTIVPFSLIIRTAPAQIAEHTDIWDNGPRLRLDFSGTATIICYNHYNTFMGL